MHAILSKPGFIGSDDGGDRLRKMYSAGTTNLDTALLSPFARSVFTGDFDFAVETGSAPDICGTETPYKWGYASFTILGAQTVMEGPPGSCRFMETLEYLFSKGLPPDVPDITGFTALDHSTMASRPMDALLRCLLKHGANVNHQDRYGAVALFGAMQHNHISTVEVLMEHGADIDIPDADGCTVREFFVSCGPRVAATMAKCLRQRTGEEALRAEKCCDACGKPPPSGGALKNCGKCRIARYCSTDCQRNAWPTHKKTCTPFSAANTATFKPVYVENGFTIPFAETTRGLAGYETDKTAFSNTRTRAAATPKHLDRQPKSIVIKVQVPYMPGSGAVVRSTGDLMVYTKKRDFVCRIRRADAPEDYERISEIVRTQGVGGAKAYFAAELESKDRLVVKVGEVLAAQPW
ncbi:ankyrin [Mycena sanguinolenta]|nr:ankyrin [Mycena sanguinolenta]